MNDNATWGNPAEQVEHRLSFYGSGREYFGIWIVNILLTIVTLGIYSAWAKVRRMRYFHGNTTLMDRGFDYHARPVQILIGRVIVFVFLVVYNVTLNLFPVAGLFVALPVFLLAMPWFIMRGLRFRARVTSYRNVRFNFTGGYWGALKAFIIGGLLSTFTFGILAPLASKWSWKYVTGNLHYGGREFVSDPPLKAMYKVWIVAALIALLATAAMVLVIASSYGLLTGLLEGDFLSDTGGLSLLAVIYLFSFTLLISYGVAGLYYSAGIRNVTVSSTSFDGKHKLLSDLSPFRYAWIAISNLFATLFSVGLLRPWAAVRLHRYVVEHTAVVTNGPIEDYMAKLEDEGTAAGSEFMDVEGIDLGF